MNRPYVYTHRVLLEETNLVGNVYFVNYVRWQGHCREQFLLDHAPGLVGELQSGDMALVTVSCSVDYLAECFAGDMIKISMTQVDGSLGGNRVSVRFGYERDGSMLATGSQTIACMRRSAATEELSPAVVPLPLREALLLFRS
jgi:enediyne core biosynthesis thioesterase